MCVYVCICVCVSAQVRGCRRPCADSLPESAPVARAQDTSHSRLLFARSTRTISAEGCAHTGPDRSLACISRTRHARSPQRVAGVQDKSHSRLHFTYSTHAISAEGCAHMGHIALSAAFPTLHTRDLRRGLRVHRTNRALACLSRAQHTRSPQRVARVLRDTSHSRLHFAHSTRTISAEGCPRAEPIALSPAFRALDARDPRQRVARACDKSNSGLHFAHLTRTISAEDRTNRDHLHFAYSTCAISAEGCARTAPIALSRLHFAHSTRAISAEGCARTAPIALSRLHFAHSTRAISAEGCAGTGQMALSPAFRALDTHDLRRGLRGNGSNRTLACISRTRHARSPQRVAFSVDAVRPTLRL